MKPFELKSDDQKARAVAINANPFAKVALVDARFFANVAQGGKLERPQILAGKSLCEGRNANLIKASGQRSRDPVHWRNATVEPYEVCPPGELRGAG